MASLSKVLSSRIALGGALLACACQHDSNAAFDDTNLPSTNPGSSGSGQGGSSASGGSSSAGRASGGGKANAGSNAGGKPSAGGAGGKGGGMAGKAGAEMAGSAGDTTTGGDAGSVATGGGGMAGTGGMSTNPETMTFQTTEIDDALVESCRPNENFGDLEIINADGSGSCRVESLVSIPLAAVPDGALVSQASLTLSCADQGAPITVSYVDGSWAELQVRWNNRPNAGTIIGTVTCDQAGEVVTLDLTTPVQAWLAGAHKNFGIYLRTDSNSGTTFPSSEAADDTLRPLLVVTYTL